MPVEFKLLPIDELLEHETVEPQRVDEVLHEIRSTGVVVHPILVDRESRVILNGHHRFAALRVLGAQRIPVYLVDYHDGAVQLDRWSAGPPISKGEVIASARAGRRYPPKTTRHTLTIPLPPHPVQLSELLGRRLRARG
jgi:L-serine kinase (ADP)